MKPSCGWISDWISAGFPCGQYPKMTVVKNYDRWTNPQDIEGLTFCLGVVAGPWLEWGWGLSRSSFNLTGSLWRLPLGLYKGISEYSGRRPRKPFVAEATRFWHELFVSNRQPFCMFFALMGIMLWHSGARSHQRGNCEVLAVVGAKCADQGDERCRLSCISNLLIWVSNFFSYVIFFGLSSLHAYFETQSHYSKIPFFKNPFPDFSATSFLQIEQTHLCAHSLMRSCNSMLNLANIFIISPR